MGDSPVKLDVYKILQQIAIDSSKTTHFLTTVHSGGTERDERNSPYEWKDRSDDT